MDKKKIQLGMNPSTAQHRLRKLVMFDLVQKCGLNKCHQCGEEIVNIDDFSIEHIKPWIDSEDPTGLFFSLDNIAFSHLVCNIKAARRVTKTDEEKYVVKRRWERENYDPEKRRVRYLETGH